MGLLSLFSGGKSQDASEINAAQQKQSGVPEKKKPLKIADVKRMYGRPSSFIDKLPWYEAQPETNTILLDDGFSVGAVFEAVPISTEGRSLEWLKETRDRVEDAVADSFDEEPDSPWIIQHYTFDDSQMLDFIQQLRQYPEQHCIDSEYTRNWLDTIESHLHGICKEGGLFMDEEVMGSSWGGKMRRTMVVIYRRLPKNWKHPQGLTPDEDLNNVCDKFSGNLRDTGIQLVRVGGKVFYDWMLAWFNPKPEMTDGDRRAFYEMAGYPGEDDRPYGDDFAESLFFSMPKSDKDKQAWIFDGMYHQCIRVNKLRRSPKVGLVAGEISMSGDKVSCLMDKMPPGTVVVTTMVVTPQSEVEHHIDRIAEKSRGESVEATYARRDCEVAKELLAHRKKLYRMTMAVYIRAESPKQLKKHNNLACSLLTSAQLQPYKAEDDPVGLDAYILNLPMVFEPRMDRNFRSSRPVWLQHMANLSSLFGRHRGTQHPGTIMFNRGGEPLIVDPFHKADRQKNAHGVILGPTGAGKSALLNYFASQIMAMHRPRMIIVEAGNSFGLLGDYFEANGLTVNKLQIKPGAGVSLAPFQDVHQLIGTTEESDDDFNDEDSIPERDLNLAIIKIMSAEGLNSHFDDLDPEEQERIRDKAVMDYLAESNMDLDDDDLEDDQRDILGEAEIIAKLMITGGEEEETKRLMRADRRMIRDAILKGARKAVTEGRTTRTDDVAWGFTQISQDETYPEKRRERAFEMGEAIRMYTDGFEGELFNSETSAWPDVDVTIVDLATLAREGYESHLALAYTSIMQNTNALAEKFQHSGRQIVMFTDEAHLITVNPLLSSFSVKIVKMWRKLHAWYWLATQNLDDFPNDSKKILNMCEWLIALVAPQEEINQLARFRQLSDEQRHLMLSARKEQHKYVEGTILADKVEALFRNVPPSLFLSLAGTEGYEKAQRAELMQEFGITEVEAAYHVAAMIDHSRGIGPKPEPPESSRRKRA
ncbi:conjugative transfer ATPase [Marinobacterium lutimaris]|uniref:Conjugative transfer ATPase, PFL_4706 family n=1 Tax=Marinobacterium lutimaris TaxID=568106 RepID=A0A1H6DUZ6_9GAMM|nr:conjugative transfer ATPase [Marinobacterium lutimaris]SEG89202.1 conjugative transfer ATPase, PFL_4706 family [Marinobacterium lutimaris]